MGKGKTGVEEFLDWLCWERATTGERFYPPDETAEECMGALYEDGELSDADQNWRHGIEHGQHSRAWLEAVDLFDSMRSWGFDPVERAERYIDEARAGGDDLPEIDWSWLRDSHYYNR